MMFAILAPLSLNIAILLYTMIYFINRRLPKINRNSFIVLFIFSISYAIIAGISSFIIGGLFEKVVHRLGINVLNIVMIVVFIIQAFGIYFHLKNMRMRSS